MGIFTDALNAIYDSEIGTANAVLQGATRSLTVIDKTAGVEAEPMGGRVTVPTLIPAACVRVAELVAVGYADFSLLEGKTITFNNQTWRILSQRPRPTPEGESAGELYLYLRK